MPLTTDDRHQQDGKTGPRRITWSGVTVRMMILLALSAAAACGESIGADRHVERPVFADQSRRRRGR